MSVGAHRWAELLRTGLILGRVSNLPTVWSNCLAAWMLAGNGRVRYLLLAWAGGTLMYVGGMFLNDACDADFDRAFRSERPIPSGRAPELFVWVVGFLLLGGGWFFLAAMGPVAAALATALLGCISLYDVLHKRIPGAPVLMAACRVLLFLAAGAGGVRVWTRLEGEMVWAAWVLGGYVLGLSYIAKGESTGVRPQPLALAALFLPFVLAGFINAPAEWSAPPVLVPALLLAGWTARSVSHLWRKGATARVIPVTVSGLLAGIVWVDLLAVLPPPWPWGAAFAALFLTACWWQRRVPAT